jgi:hypothetical protein
MKKSNMEKFQQAIGDFVMSYAEEKRKKEIAAIREELKLIDKFLYEIKEVRREVLLESFNTCDS